MIQPKVFISFKNLEKSGLISRDSELAREVHDFLTQRGLEVFFSSVSLERMGVAAYKQAIDDALDQADVVIAVGTSREHLMSEWVRYEWDSFTNDILSGLKPKGRVFAYVEGLPTAELPRALRQTQAIQHGPYALDLLYRFIINAGDVPNVSSLDTKGTNTYVEQFPFCATLTLGGKDVKQALLDNGNTIDYMAIPHSEVGSFKTVHLTPDCEYAVKLYNKPGLGTQLEKLRLLAGKYNLTIPDKLGGCGGDVESAEYYRKCFSWPLFVVVEPAVGVVVPSIPKQFIFQYGRQKGQEKVARWFQSGKLASYLSGDDAGNLIGRVKACISLARSLRRLHQLGLVFGDLSARNVLVDISRGTTLILDVESISIPGTTAPESLGTPGYMAPEIVRTENLRTGDPAKVLPSLHTDQHSLAVFIYEILFHRHPLLGPKIYSSCPEEDEILSMGIKALFIENPRDTSNALKEEILPCSILGNKLNNLFMRAFVDGLHCPELRPSALEWERALVSIEQSLYPCFNRSCPEKWFRIETSNKEACCQFCSCPVPASLPFFEIVRRNENGMDRNVQQLWLYDGLDIYDWQFMGKYCGESEDQTRRASISSGSNGWLMHFEKLEVRQLTEKGLVEISSPLLLTNGASLYLSLDDIQIGITVQIP